MITDFRPEVRDFSAEVIAAWLKYYTVHEYMGEKIRLSGSFQQSISRQLWLLHDFLFFCFHLCDTKCSHHRIVRDWSETGHSRVFLTFS